MSQVLIYGSYGYTGELIVEEGLRRELPLVLAGRNAQKLKVQADQTGLPFMVVDLNETEALKRALDGIEVVIHAAGPFVRTYEQMLDACIGTGTHYLDITGEIEVFEGIAARDADLKARNIMAMPGVGFDVVPTDCIAAHLHQQMPEATELHLAIKSVGGAMSHGTASTMVNSLGAGSLARRNGKIVEVPLAKEVLMADFGRGRTKAYALPWGDVSTAYYTTGIPNVSTYISLPPKVGRMARLSNYIRPVLRSGWVKRLAQKKVDQAEAGPDAAARKDSVSLVYGMVMDGKGNSRAANLKTLNGYTLTAKGAVTTAEKVLDGNWKAGFQTPAGHFGAQFIKELDPKAELRDL